MKHRPKDNVFSNSKYDKWVHSLPCLVCGTVGVQGHHLEHARKNVYLLLPLCVQHHMPGFPQSYHQLEREKFEEVHCLNLDWEIQKLLMQYIEEMR